MSGQNNEADGEGELMLMDEEEELKVEERHMPEH